MADLPQGHSSVSQGPGRSAAPAAGPAPARLPVRLMARLVQPGKNGGWIGGTLSWGKLDSYGYFGGYPATQVRLLRELLALYRTRVNQPYYYSQATNVLSSCPRSSPAGSGRCSTRPGKPACSWCTDTSSARWSGTGRRGSAWMSPRPRPAGNSPSPP